MSTWVQISPQKVAMRTTAFDHLQLPGDAKHDGAHLRPTQEGCLLAQASASAASHRHTQPTCIVELNSFGNQVSSRLQPLR